MFKNNRYYFAYGSNMLQERIEERLHSVEKIGTYLLKDWELKFNCTAYHYARENAALFANVIPNKNSVVEGVLYKLSYKQERLLDLHEGLYYSKNFYSKELKATIFFYVAYPEFVNDINKKPYLYYLNLIIDGALQNNLIATANKLIKFKNKNYIMPKGTKHIIHNG